MITSEIILLIDELRTLPKETEWVEFKKNDATSNEQLGKYVSALSNAACIADQPFGYLIFGICDDDHSVVNTKYRFKTRKVGNQELELWLRKLISPSIIFSHFDCQYDPQTRIELFRIPAAKGQPILFKNIGYIRFNSSVTRLKDFPDYLRKIYNSEIDWSAEIVEKASISDLDKSAIDLAREKFTESSADKSFYREIVNWSDEVLLDRMKITISGGITNTALLILAKPSPPILYLHQSLRSPGNWIRKKRHMSILDCLFW